MDEIRCLLNFMPFYLLPIEGTAFFPLKGHRIPGVILEAETGPSPDKQPTGVFTLDFILVELLKTQF